MATATVFGNIGKEIRARFTPQGKKVVSFSVAENGGYTNSAGQRVETTEWFNIEAWGKTAEIIEQYKKPGDQVFIEGDLRNETWEKDGVKHYRTKIVARKVRFGQNSRNHDDFVPEPDMEDIPF